MNYMITKLPVRSVNDSTLTEEERDVFLEQVVANLISHGRVFEHDDPSFPSRFARGWSGADGYGYVAQYVFPTEGKDPVLCILVSRDKEAIYRVYETEDFNAATLDS